MIVVMEERATEEQVSTVVDKLVSFGVDIHRSTGERYTILGVVGPHIPEIADLEVLPGVLKVVRVSAPYKLAARAFKPEGTKIKIRDVVIGGEEVAVIAGTGAVESVEHLESLAAFLKSCGVRILLANVFGSQASPHGFQGLGEKGLAFLRETAAADGMVTASEIFDSSQLRLLNEYADIIVISAGNARNYELLRELARLNKPLILRRNASATIEETLMSAEFLMTAGNHQVILCECGIRTFENYTQHTLDLSSVPVINKLSHLPIIADPGQALGRRDKIPSMARAAVAAGADGIIIKVHPDPDRALSQGAQSLYPEKFRLLMHELGRIASAINRTIQPHR
jgi:3-deoxy-7-phosphoheptulonate synthase